MTPRQATWTLGGLALIACGVIGILQSTVDLGPAAWWLAITNDALYAVALVLFALVVLALFQRAPTPGVATARAEAHTAVIEIQGPITNDADANAKDIIENAKVDGATDFMIFVKIILPLSFPALASFAIFQFLWTWNDLLVSMVFLGGSSGVAPLTVYISQLSGSRGSAWYLLSAGAFISMVIPVAVFLIMQRYFVRGLTAGAVK